eukprot:gene4902-5983_t
MDVDVSLSATLEDYAFEYTSTAVGGDLQAEARYGTMEKVCAVLGMLSRRRFEAITSRFCKEMEPRVKMEAGLARAEVIQLCHCLHQLCIGLSTPAELRAATAFLRTAQPLRWVPPKKKSEVQHAVAEMLVKVLSAGVGRPVSLSPDHSQHVRQWFEAVSTVRQEITAWVKQSEKKHIVDVKQRKTALECLHLLLVFYLRSNGRGEHNDNMWARIQAAVTQVIASLRKGGCPGEPHREILVQICAVATEIHSEFGLHACIESLLTSEPLSENVSIGLQALLAAMESGYAERGASGAALGGLLGGGVAGGRGGLASAASSRREAMLQAVREGRSPLAEHGIGTTAMLPQLRVHLGHILRACHAAYGQALLTASRALHELVAKERMPGLSVLRLALRCLPYVLPQDWTTGRQLAESVAPYTLHAEASVRQEAAEALQRCVQAVPETRWAVLRAVVAQTWSMPDELPQQLYDTARLCISLMHAWQERLAGGEEAAVATFRPSGVGGGGQSGEAGVGMEVVRCVEATGLMLLCSLDTVVRQCALDLVMAVRDLHCAVLAAESQKGDVAGARGAPEEVFTYVADVAEVGGEDIVGTAWFDALEWYERLGGGGGMGSGAPSGLPGAVHENLRWGMCVSQLIRQSWELCPAAVGLAAHHTLPRLRALMHPDAAHGGGHLVPPEEGRRLDMWRNYGLLLCSAGPGSLAPSKDSYRLLLPALRYGVEAQQAAAAAALGRTHPEAQELLFEELAPIEESLTERTRLKGKRREVRTYLSAVFRMLAEGARPGPCLRRACTYFLAFMEDTLRHVAPNTGGGAVGGTAVPVLGSDGGVEELLLVRQALCKVVQQAGPTAAACAPSQCTPALRRQLFVACAQWCAESPTALRIEAEKTAAAAGASGTGRRDSHHHHQEVHGPARVVDQMAETVWCGAQRALAALLQGPAFDADARKPHGRVFSWITKMFTIAPATRSSGASAWAPAADIPAGIARSALLHHLQANLELFSMCIDLCYHSDRRIGNGYFSVLAEVGMRWQVKYELPVLLCLLQHKVGDPDMQTRHEAVQMLEMVKERHPGAPAAQGSGRAGQAVVAGEVPETYVAFQCQLSSSLASQYAQLSPAVCVEMIERALESARLRDGPAAAPAEYASLAHLLPWVDKLSFAKSREDETPTDRVLRGLYQLTVQREGAATHDIEQLWRRVACKVRNIAPVVDFLILSMRQEHRSQERRELYLAVCKRVALYLARVAPQTTIDKLVFEVSSSIYCKDTDAQDAPAPSLAGSKSISRGVQRFPRVTLRAVATAGAPLISCEPSGVDTAPALSRRPPKLACEHDDDLRGHLPLLLHATVVSLDTVEPTVAAHGQQLLINLVGTLALKPLEGSLAAGGDAAQVGGEEGPKEEHENLVQLMAFLRGMKGHAMWGREDAELGGEHIASAGSLGALVELLVDAMRFDCAELRERWGKLALQWALQCSSQHLACRSQQADDRGVRVCVYEERQRQVYRALAPPATAEACQSLLACLHRCVLHPVPEVLNFALEVMLTLRHIAMTLAEEKLILYPQLLWAAIALLHTPLVHLYLEGVHLLALVLRRWNLASSAVDTVLLATRPQGSAPLQGEDGLVSLLLKGLTTSASRQVTGAVLAHLVRLPHCSALVAASRALREERIVTATVCLLPSLWIEVVAAEARMPPEDPLGAAAAARDLAEACAQLGAHQLAQWLTSAAELCEEAARAPNAGAAFGGLGPGARGNLRGGADHSEVAELQLLALRDAVCGAFFPRHAPRCLVQLMVLVQSLGALPHQRAVLQLLASWLQHPALADSKELHGVVASGACAALRASRSHLD